MSDRIRLGNTFFIQDIDHVLSDSSVEERSGISWFLGSPIAQHVGHNEAVALAPEVVDLVVPSVRGVREPMYKQEGRLVMVWLDT